MDKILKNSWIFIILILLLLFKENIYKIFYPQQYEFNYLKENELNYYKNEYLKVLDKYDIKDFSANDYIYSKVIYRNIYDFYNKLVITKGKDYKINKNSAVVTNKSLVGLIDKVNKNSSDVILLYNNKFKLSVKINDIYGILESKNNELIVSNILSDSNVNVNDIVSTSGLTDIPENIPVAIVESVTLSKDKLSKKIKVKEISNLKDIDYLMIINKKESTDEQ